MQTIRMAIDVFRFWRMKLNDAFFCLPEEILDKTHFNPIRTTIGAAD